MLKEILDNLMLKARANTRLLLESEEQLRKLVEEQYAVYKEQIEKKQYMQARATMVGLVVREVLWLAKTSPQEDEESDPPKPEFIPMKSEDMKQILWARSRCESCDKEWDNIYPRNFAFCPSGDECPNSSYTDISFCHMRVGGHDLSKVRVLKTRMEGEPFVVL